MNCKNNLSFSRVLNTRVKGSGGIIFIIISVISVFTLNAVTKLSSEDMVKSIANQSAYFATYRAAIYLYNTEAESGVYTSISDNTGELETLNLTKEYRNILESVFNNKVDLEDLSFSVEWDKDSMTARSVNVSPIKVMLTKGEITPDQQFVIME